MKKVPLTQGKFAIVDDADFESVSSFNWFADKVGRMFYAGRKIRNASGKWVTLRMHQFLFPGNVESHHFDGDGLNNQRKNLRAATRQQNLRGLRRKKLGATSKFRGVCWVKRTKKWHAQIRVDKTNPVPIHLGYFDSEIEAAKVYDAAAKKYFGVFASCNFE